jgi:hypothetical protein
MDWKSNRPLIIESGFAVVAIAAFTLLARWDGLNFSIDPTKIMSILSPLILTAGFIERAVEILISPWRDAEASVLQKALDAAQRAVPPVPADIETASNAIDRYRGKTQQYAFGVSLTLSLAVSMVGVRTLLPLLATAPQYGAPHQHAAFVVIDVALSAALLCGGADGIHSVINMFTTYFDSTADKAQKAAAA